LHGILLTSEFFGIRVPPDNNVAVGAGRMPSGTATGAVDEEEGEVAKPGPRRGTGCSGQADPGRGAVGGSILQILQAGDIEPAGSVATGEVRVQPHPEIYYVDVVASNASPCVALAQDQATARGGRCRERSVARRQTCRAPSRCRLGGRQALVPAGQGASARTLPDRAPP
jgi:hypothetical protein